MRKTLISVLCFVTVGAISAVGHGSVIVYDLGNPNVSPPALQAVGAAIYSVTHSGITLTAHGFDSGNNPKLLEWKAQGGDENGLGFTDTLDNEITLNSSNHPANYIQIDVTAALSAGGLNGEIKVGSVTGGEAFDVWGSNTLGSLGTNLVSGNTTDNAFITIPSWGLYNFIAVTVHPEILHHMMLQDDSQTYTDNVVLGAVEFTQSDVPEPATLSLLAVGGLAFLRRNRKTWSVEVIRA